MGKANASYLPAVLEDFGGSLAYGRKALRRLRAEADLPEEGLVALRRYSASEYSGQEDGKVLNAALLSNSTAHDGWAADMDAAFVWSFDRDVLLWRGLSAPMAVGEPSRCFVSATLVERQARKFRSRGGAGLVAILLPAGSRVAVPSLVWSQADDERTLLVVGYEAEVILPRGTVLLAEGHVRPLGDQNRARVMLCRAHAPDLRPTPGMR